MADDVLDSMDTEDTEDEEMYNTRKLKDRKILNDSSHQDADQNGSNVRRSTRNKSQTYDNLNCSWIFGTHTVKGYPAYNKHDSSSDKEIEDEELSRPSRRRQTQLRSRENHLNCKTSSRHLRDLNNHSSSRELRERPHKLRDLRERATDREQSLLELQEQRERRKVRSRFNREQELRNGPQLREKSDRELRDRSDRDISLRRSSLRERKDRDRPESDSKNLKGDTKDKSDVKTANEERELRPRKLESPSRSRDGPVTRLSNSYSVKNEKPKSEDDEADDDEDDNDDNSHESEKAENNENSDNEGYQDMYSRVKRTRRVSQRQLQKRQIAADCDSSESSDAPGPRKYSLRQKKPVVDRFQINAEPRRSIAAFRTVFNNTIRRRKHRSKSTSSSDSSDSEPQRYEKKNKKSRQAAIPQGGLADRKADISPITIDTNITFNDVGGLESHIYCLKEMVVFPMMYPEIFDRFHLTPPKGVLFHGPPGTGKTLIARALANECSQGSRKVSFFMRKGADCLTKWVGESERQLRMLFEQAQQMKPSIIFFDEIDGLAPVRSTKQDQIHASIVSTLLALMDGLSDRGEVIVIGATNRIDAIDPALRRPGRFDRELFFPLPAVKERLEILKIHVKKWSNPPADYLLETLAEKATGYCGSDLKALCTEAVIQSLKRTYPQIYKTSKRLLLNPERVEVKKADFVRASSFLVPSSHRVTPCVGRRLEPFMEPLFSLTFKDLLTSIKKIFPQGSNHALAKLKVAKGVHRPRILITGGSMSRNQGPLLAKAVIYNMEHLPVHTLNVSTLFAESARSPEEACVQVFNEAARNIPSIIYIASLDQWWPLVPETVKAVFLCRIASLDLSMPILIIATSEVPHEELPDPLKNLFSVFREEIHSIAVPTEDQRTRFFKPIFTERSLRLSQAKKKSNQILEELPLAPDPEPKKLTEEEKKVLYEKEEISLRELRIFLREICAKLARNRQFFMFTKPVDTEEVPDYNIIIQQPMDLETMMTKIDLHHYMCARDFLDDIDLICKNALEYNPDREPADKLIRHRACSLRDNAYALIKAELDSDFEDKCREISKSRKNLHKVAGKKKESPKVDSKQPVEKGDKKEVSVNSAVVVNGKRLPSSRKRKMWARGYVKKVCKKKKICFEDGVHNSESCAEKTACDGGGGSATAADASSQSLDLDKDYETEGHSVLNGHLPVYDHTDTDNDSQSETTKDPSDAKQQAEIITEKCPTETSLLEKIILHTSTDESKNQAELDNIDVLSPRNDKGIGNNSLRSPSPKNSSFDDEDFALDDDSDSSLANNLEEGDRVIIDKVELERVFTYTVQATKHFSIESLCDVYVQLSRRVGQYSRSQDRKSLPKDLLDDVKRFEKHTTTENKRLVQHE